MRRENVFRAVIGGGVAANGRLRTRLDTLAQKNDYDIYYPPRELCTDNGAMIAGLGYWLLEDGQRDDLSLDADPVTAR